jgi:23S rRNA (guanosine2251-2'-O)-methyltransferase
LSSRSRRPAHLGGEQIEGRQAVRELVVAGRRAVKEVWIGEHTDAAQVLDEIIDAAADRGIAVRSVNRGRLEATARTDSPQGVIAFAAPLVEADLDALAQRGRDGLPFLLVLDGVTDPHNLGALLRTAACAGVTGVVVPRHRATHITPTVAKAAAGAIEHVPLALVPGVPAALARLGTAGVWTVGLDANGTASVWDLQLATEPLALVLGGEGQGLSRLTRDRCDVVVHIPQRDVISSLNVAAAGAIACFEVSRRRQDP